MCKYTKENGWFRSQGYRTKLDIGRRKRVWHRWKKGSEKAKELFWLFLDAQQHVRRKIEDLERREEIILSKMYEIWQDNDAPQAEEITMTSLLVYV